MRAYRAEDEAAGDPADAVVWDELAPRRRKESTLNATYLMFLCLARMIAAQSAAQLLINLIGITLAGVAVLWVRQRSEHRQQAGARPV